MMPRQKQPRIHRTAGQVSLPSWAWDILNEMERKGIIKNRSRGVERGIELLAEENHMIIHLPKDEAN